MRNSILLLAGVSLLAMSLCAGAAEQCRYSAPRNAEIDAAGLKLLSAEIGPDDLNIQGEPGLAKIEVHGTACASDEKWLQDVQVETARHGDTASVIAQDGHHENIFSLFGNSYAYLKLDLRVPQSLAIKLKQGSGDTHASNIAALDASLGSGDLDLDGVAGEFRLDMGSGDVKARKVGSFNLTDLGSGDVGVDGVQGDAQVGSIGSGDLTLANIKRDMSIDTIGSGDVKITGVGGSLKLGHISSGGLVIRNVTGDVTVGSISSGDVSITNAGGNVHADHLSSGGFGADGVGGDFSVGSVGSGDVHHHGVKGKVSVPRSDD
ncbi:MAG TPA: DUF4097 family beta strand repeat-containing protein [Rhodanobacteraceae bacterium]|nr:DUF4097 family beta strand repeat-containing protein [Rhodanobacteraceae bacterium]